MIEIPFLKALYLAYYYVGGPQNIVIWDFFLNKTRLKVFNPYPHGLNIFLTNL